MCQYDLKIEIYFYIYRKIYRLYVGVCESIVVIVCKQICPLTLHSHGQVTRLGWVLLIASRCALSVTFSIENQKQIHYIAKT